MKIWLADLTHTGQTIASDAVPAAIGMIAEFIEEHCPDITEIRLFKFPEALSEAFENDAPDLIGFGNYIWNGRLSLAYAEAIRRNRSETVVVMGGPNFPTVADEQKRWLQANPFIDFFIMKEGELAFLRLIEQLLKVSMDASAVDLSIVPNVVRLNGDNDLEVSLSTERVMDLERIRSPYVSGRLDAFLDGRFMPVIQTNRGCPFSCAFCTEGQLYWNKVRRKSDVLIRDELRHIASHMNRLPTDKRRHDLLIADSNFGMFAEDLQTCEVIAKVQEKYDYPRYINVATGKNKKERVLEAARIVNGAMKLAGSVQSLDPKVQANMKRSNISAEQIVDLALKAGEVGTNTYSEVILALPGDSREAHFNTLKTLVDADFSTISMYQLMILPGTEFGLDSIKTLHQMVLKHRVLPRAFGSYPLFDEVLNVAEIEEICIENATLPYQDYLACRRMNLIVGIFYNDRVFGELLQLLRWHDLSVWDFMLHIFENRYSDQFEELVQSFIEETEGELWDSFDELAEFTASPGTIERYRSGEFGSNLMFKSKALSMTAYFSSVCEVAAQAAEDFLAQSTSGISDALRQAVSEAITFKRLQIEGLFFGEGDRSGIFQYDIAAIDGQGEPIPLNTLKFSAPQTVSFSHTVDQQREIQGYLDIFGNSLPGLTRILSRVFLRQLFRAPSVENSQQLTARVQSA